MKTGCRYGAHIDAQVDGAFCVLSFDGVEGAVFTNEICSRLNEFHSTISPLLVLVNSPVN